MGDSVNRQAAIDAAKAYLMDCLIEDADWHGDGIEYELNSLPSAQPERKKGKWVYGENDGQDGWYCSECGGFVPWDYDYYGLDNIDFIKDFKTCPRCDARMISYTGMEEGEQE